MNILNRQGENIFFVVSLKLCCNFEILSEIPFFNIKYILSICELFIYAESIVYRVNLSVYLQGECTRGVRLCSDYCLKYFMHASFFNKSLS